MALLVVDVPIILIRIIIPAVVPMSYHHCILEDIMIDAEVKERAATTATIIIISTGWWVLSSTQVWVWRIWWLSTPWSHLYRYFVWSRVQLNMINDRNYQFLREEDEARRNWKRICCLRKKIQKVNKLF